MLKRHSFIHRQKSVSRKKCLPLFRTNSMHGVAMTAKTRPLFSFGLIADIQYADKESRSSGSRLEGIMNYRKGVGKLKEAIEHWSARKKDLKFVLNLGDIIDGNATEEQTLADFKSVIQPFYEFNNDGDAVMVHHVVGNHCLRVQRNFLLERLGLRDSYYSWKIDKGWKLIVLDTNDLGPHAYGETQIQETEKFLEEHPAESYPSIQRWNGGIASVQLNWLRKELAASKAGKEKVIVACHHPVGEGSARPTHMAWNCFQIQEALLESGVVSLVLSGHDHLGGYKMQGPTHFLTLHSVVEAPGDNNSFAIVEVYSDGMMLHGIGSAQTIWMSLESMQSSLPL